MYEVVDRHTKKVVGKYKTRKGANRAVDRLDIAHGAVRYFARSVG